MVSVLSNQTAYNQYFSLTLCHNDRLMGETWWRQWIGASVTKCLAMYGTWTKLGTCTITFSDAYHASCLNSPVWSCSTSVPSSWCVGIWTWRCRAPTSLTSLLSRLLTSRALFKLSHRSSGHANCVSKVQHIQKLGVFKKFLQQSNAFVQKNTT